MTRVSLPRAPWDPAPEPALPAVASRRFNFTDWREAHPDAYRAATRQGGLTATTMRRLDLSDDERRAYRLLRKYGVERDEALRISRAAP